MNNTSTNAQAFKINQRLRLLQDDVRDYRAALDHSIVNLGIAKWVTFILYFTAVWTLYVYDVWGVADFLSSNMGDLPAFVIFGTVSVMLPRFLSRTKEDRYKDIAEDVASGRRLSTIGLITLVFFAFSGLFFELFTATSQQQHITTAAAENSRSFKSTEQGITIASNSNTALAEAERKVALCYAKKEKTCAGDEARVTSLKSQEARDSEKQIAASTALFTAQHTAREELKEEANKPLFKMIRDSFGVSINTGMIIGVAVMITIFELTHIINLFTYASRLRRWRQANEEMIEMNGEYMELTGHVVSSDDFDDMKKPARPIPVISQAIPQDFKAPVINTPEPKQPQPVFNNATIAHNDSPAPSSIASTIKMIVQGVDANKAKTADDIKKAVYNTYSVLPRPAPLDDAELDKVAEKIADDRGLNNLPPAISTPDLDTRKVSFGIIPQRPSNQFKGGTGIHNPVLGKAETIFPLPLPVVEMLKNDALQQNGTDGTDESVPNATERNTMERVGTGEAEAFQSVLTRSTEEGGSVPPAKEEANNTEKDSENFERMRKVFEENESFEAGREVFCPVCTVPFLKKRSNQRFCCSEDKAHYWKLAKRNGYRRAGDSA